VVALAHLSVLLVLGVVAALTVRPIVEPAVQPVFFQVGPPPEILTSLDPRPKQTPAPSKDGGHHEAMRAIVPPARIDPVTQPTRTPDELPPTPPSTGDDANASGPGQVGQGSETGIPGASGDGSGGGGDDQGSGGPVVITGEMIAPRLLSSVDPVYPNAARIARLPGKVVVEAVIGVDGRVESARVIASTNPLFDEAALEAVRKRRYTPATMNGRPVSVYFTVAITFVIR
jgi:protein TonB